jgi:hypothetical protein
MELKFMPIKTGRSGVYAEGWLFRYLGDASSMRRRRCGDLRCRMFLGQVLKVLSPTPESGHARSSCYASSRDALSWHVSLSSC